MVAYLLLVLALLVFIAGAGSLLWGLIEAGATLEGAAAVVLAAVLIVGSFFIAGAAASHLPPRKYRVTVVQVPPR